jgi:hypothetical protein
MPTPRYRGGRPRKHPEGVRTSIHGIIRPPGSVRVQAGTGYGGRLLTPCWCERYHDYLPAIDIAQGRTWSCGAPNCKPTGDAA